MKLTKRELENLLTLIVPLMEFPPFKDEEGDLKIREFCDYIYTPGMLALVERTTKAMEEIDSKNESEGEGE